MYTRTLGLQDIFLSKQVCQSLSTASEVNEKFTDNEWSKLVSREIKTIHFKIFNMFLLDVIGSSDVKVWILNFGV